MDTDTRQAPLPLPPHEQGRADFHALIGALLLAPPGAPLLQALAAAPALPQGGAAPADHAALARAWQGLRQAARTLDAQAVAAEHAALFWAAGTPQLDPCASVYLVGAPMDHPLAAVRQDLQALGLARQGGAPHTEDHLGALCEALRLLITGAPAPHAGAPALPPRSLAVQRRFFARHLAPWAAEALADMRRASLAQGGAGPHFYAAVADLVEAFFDTEAEAFELEDDVRPGEAGARGVFA